ncbi:MAG: M56 family metallopeptidase [Terriglobales bacterium]
MSAPPDARLAADFLTFLVSPAVRSLLLAAAAGLALRALHVRRVAARLAAWKFVLYAALAMPLLAAFLPPIRFGIPAPGFFAATAAPAARASAPAAVTAPAGVAVLPTPRAGAAALSTSAPPPRPRPQRRAVWVLSAVGLYGLVALLFLLRLALGWLAGRRLRRVARTITADEAPSELGAAARAAGLTGPPLLAETDLISVPATLGMLRPVILLPADWRDWEAAKLRAVLAHEASHIARGDPLTRGLALLHRALFWFSPLAWRLDRKLAELAEEASDEAALGAGADRAGYAETLLGFFAAAQAAPGRVRWQEIAMASAEGRGRQAARRLERILAWKGDRNMKSQRSMMMLAAAVAAPLALLAAAAQPRFASAKSAPRAVAAPAAVAAPLVRATAEPRPRAQAVATAEASFAYAPQDGNSDAALSPYDVMAVVAEGHCAVLSRWNTSYGSCADSQLPSAAVSLRKSGQGNFIWFERDGKGYVVTDAATVSRAAALFQPVRELGRQQTLLGATQSNLGKEQGRLGEQQSQLGASQAEVRVKAGSVPDFSAQLQKIAARLKELAARGASQGELAEVQGELANLQGELGALQGRAGDQQAALGAQQANLAERQAKLGEQQAQLGQKQAALGQKQAAAMREVERQLKMLLDSASKNGLAKAQ